MLVMPIKHINNLTNLQLELLEVAVLMVVDIDLYIRFCGLVARGAGFGG